jgi:hypothetical protein
LQGIVDELRADTLAQFVGKAVDYHRRPGATINNADISGLALKRFDQRWQVLPSRLTLVPGKEALTRLNQLLRDSYGVNLTPASILTSMTKQEVPQDMMKLLTLLEQFRKTGNSGSNEVDGHLGVF